jgi:heme-degrading monooxygenase HmoA
MKFIAMNRFKIVPGQEDNFESIWKNRETHLDDVPGFIKFNLIRGKDGETYTLYASHSVWKSKGDFEAWTKSEEFRLAHKNAGSNKNLYLGHPEFEGFEIII